MLVVALIVDGQCRAFSNQYVNLKLFQGGMDKQYIKEQSWIKGSALCNIFQILYQSYLVNSNCPTSWFNIMACADNCSLVADASSAVAALLSTTPEI